MKCTICNNKVETTFLGKINGTYVKKKVVCNACQKQFPSKKELLEKVS